MTGLCLSLAEQPAFDLDLSAVLPETVDGKSIDEVHRTPLAQGKRRVMLGDLFEIRSIPENVLEFQHVSEKLHRIGSGMTRGLIRVIGNTGNELGRQMSGGEIQVSGNSGDYLGSGMRGGIINVSGNCGDFTAGALPHTAIGMRDGLICIGNSVGMRAGERMRRGLLIVNGNAGPYCGSNMIAGTIVVTGHAAAGIGIGMRRGTLLLKHAPSEIPATFNECGTFPLTFSALLLRHLRRVNHKAYSQFRSIQAFRRLAGDVACNGQGEFLVAVQ